MRLVPRHGEAAKEGWLVIETQFYRVTSKVSTDQFAERRNPAQLPKGSAPNSMQDTRPHDMSHSAPNVRNGQLSALDNMDFLAFSG